MARNNNLKDSDEHYTPKWIFDALGIQFDLDVASPLDSAKSNVPAKYKFTIEDNGLNKEWFGNVWLNPPYAGATPWANKFMEHRHGIALLVVSRSKWFRALWNESDAICITPPDLKFHRPDGTSKSIAFMNMLFAFGEENVEALKALNLRIR